MGNPKDNSDRSEYTSRDGYVHKDDGTYIRGRNGRDYQISEDPNAEGDDGTGRDSDGGNSD